MAVIQENVKRLLAYSSIAHAGYLLIGFVPGTAAGYAAVRLLPDRLPVHEPRRVRRGRRAREPRPGLRAHELARRPRAARGPALAALMTLFMISLAGIPGTAGFIGKFLIFSAAVDAGQVRARDPRRADERRLGLLLPARAGADVHARARRRAAAAAPPQRRGHRARDLRRRRASRWACSRARHPGRCPGCTPWTGRARARRFSRAARRRWRTSASPSS